MLEHVVPVDPAFLVDPEELRAPLVHACAGLRVRVLAAPLRGQAVAREGEQCLVDLQVSGEVEPLLRPAAQLLAAPLLAVAEDQHGVIGVAGSGRLAVAGLPGGLDLAQVLGGVDGGRRICGHG